MIRGTTPTLEYKLPSNIDLNLLDNAEIIVSYTSGMKRILIEKTLLKNECYVNKETCIIGTKLTQQDTLQLPVSNCVECQLRIKLNDDTVLATKPKSIEVYKLLREGEL